jgi:hypothetical protein
MTGSARALLALTLLIGGCSSGPKGGGDSYPQAPPQNGGGNGAGAGGGAFPGGGGTGDSGASNPTADSGSADTGEPNLDAGARDSGIAVDTGPSQSCTYPAGPYDVTQGSVVSPTLTWQGYLGGSTQVTTITMSDLFDCDGTKGVNAIAIDESATWCGACQQEAPAVDQLMNGTWGQEGVRALTLMVQDANQNPATTQTASDWIQMFAITKTEVAADPNFTFGAQGVNGLPTNVVVDPRTMIITAVLQGYDPSDTTVDTLAQKNAHH